MSFISQSQKILCCGLIMVAVAVTAGPARAQFPELDVSISDTTVSAGDTTAWISVFIRNYQDTLSGFAMRVVLDRPDIMEFKTDVVDTIIDTIYWECTWWNDNVCLDSIPVNPPLIDTFYVNGGFDTTGCLINYWNIVSASSWSEERHDIRVIGIADEVGPPNTPGLKPRTSQGLLFRMNVRIYDPLPADTDSVVVLLLDTDLSSTNFSDQFGNSIGTVTNYNICDTGWCDSWDYTGDSCFTELYDTIPDVFDSMLVDTFFRWHYCQVHYADSLDTLGNPVCSIWNTYSDPEVIFGLGLDTLDADFKDVDSAAWSVWNAATVSLDGGELRVVEISCLCGDADNNDILNIGDAVYLINYIFKGGPAPLFPECSDVNNDNDLNIGDPVYLINYIFKGGPPPYCGF